MPYKSVWPEQFLEIRNLLASKLKNTVISIDHIGSTSVPGLAAKDRIDVQISVKSIDEPTKLQLDKGLIAAGFKASFNNVDHRPAGDNSSEDNWVKFYARGDHPDLNFKANIHIRKYEAENQKYALLFRDFLRANQTPALAYQKLKQELTRYYPQDRIAYCEIKDPVCDLVMIQAQSWKDETNWCVSKSIHPL